MAKTKILFSSDTAIKEKAYNRAHREGTDLTTVLNQALLLYAEGVFDPENLLSKADITAIRRGLADFKEGRVYMSEEIDKYFKSIEDTDHA